VDDETNNNVANFPDRRSKRTESPAPAVSQDERIIRVLESLATAVTSAGATVVAQSAQVNHLVSVVMRLEKTNAVLIAALRGAAPTELDRLLSELKVRDVES